MICLLLLLDDPAAFGVQLLALPTSDNPALSPHGIVVGIPHLCPSRIKTRRGKNAGVSLSYLSLSQRRSLRRPPAHSAITLVSRVRNACKMSACGRSPGPQPTPASASVLSAWRSRTKGSGADEGVRPTITMHYDLCWERC